MKIWTLILTLLALNSAAATYYIDYATGADANNGTSKVTPWKRAPKMTGFTGNYNHANGDRFIFKGGVTWLHEVFPMKISQGGASGNRDYYGVDLTWYTGGTWARPIFSKEGVYGENFLTFTAGHIFIENIEFTGMHDNGSTGGSGITYWNVGVQPDVYFKSCYAHGWSYSGTAGDSLDVFLGSSTAGSYSDTQIIDSCVFDGEVAGQGIGMAMHFGGQIVNSVIRNMPNGILPLAPNAVVAGNEIYNITQSAFGRHENAFEDLGCSTTVRFYNNKIHDCTYGLIAFFGGGTATNYIYNNVIWNNGRKFLDIETRYSPGKYYIWNNTIESSGSPALHVTGTGVIPLLHIGNNHFITSASTANSFDGTNYTTLITASNLVQTPASAEAQGYKASQVKPYSPASASAATNNTGTPDTDTGSIFDISGKVVRPTLNSWDVGAYEYDSAPVSNAIVTITVMPPP